MEAVFRNARIYAESEPFDGLCVVADVPLHCSTELAGVPALITSATGAESSRAARTDLRWRAPDEEEHVIHVWQLFLKAHFGAPGWSIAVGMPRRVAFEALGDFRVMFVLVILAAISIVFLLSNDQIRRTLGPLQALTHAAMKIRDGHFGERIAVQSKDEFGELGSAFNHMSIELGAQFDTLRTLHSLDRAVLTSLDEDVVVNELLERGGSVLNAMAGAVVLLDRDASGRGRAYAASSGNAVGRSFRTSDVAHEWLHQTLQGQPSVIVPVGSLDGNVLDTPPLNTATEGAFLILALRTSGAGLIGALVFHIRADISDTSTFERARQIADQSSVALTAVRLVAELQDFGWGALTALARTIDAKSPWTSGHSERVASLSRAIAEEIGLPPDQIEILRRAALLHDIGKLAIPPAILDKAGRLTREERLMLETHVNVGVRILEPIRAFADILPAIQDHHERLNGSGYPNGKRGDEIDPLGRIIAVADVFDAVVSDRPYRVGMAETHVLQMLRDEAGVILDAAVVDAFARVLTLSMVTEIPLVERGSSTRSSGMKRREDT
jgi:putative nucleotidyltransferase with HDIG domain